MRGVVCMCQCGFLSLPSCGGVGGVGLVTHYKCQRDLSPKPVHLLLGAAGATDGELVIAQTASTHKMTFTTYSVLSHSPSNSSARFHARLTGVLSYGGSPAKFPGSPRTFTVKQYVVQSDPCIDIKV